MLTEVKLALRIKATALDNDLNGLIEAARLDMRIAGIRAPDLRDGAPFTNHLIKRAVILYCKAEYNFGGIGDKYAETYRNLKARLSLANLQTEGAGDTDE